MSMSVSPAAIVRLAVIVFVAALLVPAVPDFDLWGHTLFGGDILRTGTLPDRDHYSFTSDIPWVNHEWLSEVAMWAAYAAGGGAGLVTLRLLLLVLLLGIVWRAVRHEGASAEAAVALVTMLALLTYTRTLPVRPQLFSLIAFAALLATLMQWDRTRRVRDLLPVPLIMLFWANTHGGFLVALMPIGLWGLSMLAATDLPLRTRLQAAGVMGLGVPTTLLTPYGLGLWEFLARTVRIGRDDIVEWEPVTALGVPFVALWMLIAVVAVAGIAWQEGRRPLHRVALVGVLAIMSFRVSRLDAFFAVATIVCLAAPLSTYWVRRRVPGRSLKLNHGAAIGLLALSTAVSTGVLLSATPQGERCVDDSSWMPDPAATAFIARNRLEGRLVVFFNWGEYALWQFGPGLQVSTDGRRETVYSDRHIQAHLQLYQGTDAGLAYLRELDAHYIWFPTSLPVVPMLQRDGWHTIYQGERSVILSRTAAAPDGSPWLQPESACYPGDIGRPSPLESGLWRQYR